MPEPTRPESVDVKALWRDQPVEHLPSPSPEILQLRSRRLYAITRSEILASLAAGAFFAAVLGWRLGLNRIAVASMALVMIWATVTAFWLRSRVWRHAGVNAFATSSVEFYRAELEKRRRHLRNAWLWHGPLLLGCVALAAVAFGTMPRGAQRLLEAWPLLLALLLWSGFGILRRRRQAEEIRRELDQLADR